MKKVIFVLFLLFVIIGAMFSLGWFYSQRKNDNMVKEVIELVGGEKAIKMKCIEKNTGDIELSTGESYKRILSLDDIVRVHKMCDCAVAKAGSIISDMQKEFSSEYNLLENIKDSLLKSEGLSNEELVDGFLTIFSSGYKDCETEVLKWFDGKYPTVSLE